MPNWCSNYANITGSKEAIENITRDINSIKNTQDRCVFKTLVGIKPEITEEEYENDGWYEANCDYWGTKWDVSINDCNFVIGSTNIMMYPETAWSPPIGFYEALAKKYGVNVHAEYNEIGCDFAGYVSVNRDGDVNDNCYPYMEGLYNTDIDHFLLEVESNVQYRIEDCEEEITEDYLREQYPFVDDKIMEELIDLHVKQN